MQFDPVEAEALGRGRRVGERGDDVVEVLLRHGASLGLTRQGEARGPDRLRVHHRRGTLGAGDAHVPQLRNDRAARPVHGVRDIRPARERVLAVEPGDPAAGARGVVVDVGALGDDQSHTARGPTRVVVRHVLAGDAARGELPGHRCHGDPVARGEPAHREGAREGVRRTVGGRVRPGCHVCHVVSCSWVRGVHPSPTSGHGRGIPVPGPMWSRSPATGVATVACGPYATRTRPTASRHRQRRAGPRSDEVLRRYEGFRPLPPVRGRCCRPG